MSEHVLFNTELKFNFKGRFKCYFCDDITSFTHIIDNNNKEIYTIGNILPISPKINAIVFIAKCNKCQKDYITYAIIKNQKIIDFIQDHYDFLYPEYIWEFDWDKWEDKKWYVIEKIIGDSTINKEIKLYLIMELLYNGEISFGKAKEWINALKLFSEPCIVIDAQLTDYWHKYMKEVETKKQL